jgi:DNA-binding MarR family transcriptional regulator
MVNLVDELEREERLQRRRNPHDRRAYLVEITPSGRGVLSEADQRVQILQNKVFAPMVSEDRAELVRLLRLLVDGGHLPGFARSADV